MSHSFDKEYWCLLCVGAMLGTRSTEMEKLWFLSSRSSRFSSENLLLGIHYIFIQYSFHFCLMFIWVSRTELGFLGSSPNSFTYEPGPLDTLLYLSVPQVILLAVKF